MSPRFPDPTLAQNDCRLLVDIGFLAAGLGDVEAADCIFAGVRAADATGVATLIGPALARMNAGRAADAVALLSIAGTSDDASVDAWRAVALHLAGRRHEARRLARDVSSGSGAAARMARALCSATAPVAAGKEAA